MICKRDFSLGCENSVNHCNLIYPFRFDDGPQAMQCAAVELRALTRLRRLRLDPHFGRVQRVARQDPGGACGYNIENLLQ